jgi:hypothetical protein
MPFDVGFCLIVGRALGSCQFIWKDQTPPGISKGPLKAVSHFTSELVSKDMGVTDMNNLNNFSAPRTLFEKFIEEWLEVFDLLDTVILLE